MSSGAASAPSRWLYGPVADLAFGAGLIYLLPFALMVVANDALHRAVPLGLMPLVALLISVPHYGATLLRVYERREDRRTYALFTVWATVALVAWFAAGLHVDVVGSALVTVYFTWSPWHYASQNYGVAALFLRRAGAAPSPALRHALRAAFLSSFVLAFLALHGEAPVATYAPGALESSALGFRSLGLPGPVADVLLAVAGVAWAVLSLGAGGALVRRFGARAAAPALALLGTQALWFAVPVLARHLSVLESVAPFSTDDTVYAFLWIGFAHGAQYLWITAYLARRQGRSTHTAGFVLRAIAFGALAWTVPALLFAPGALGRVPYDAGLATLVAALVNVHHFVIDGAIWKLRDGPVARALLREAPPESTATGGRAVTRVAFAVGAVAAVGTLVADAATHFELSPALSEGDARRAAAAADRLAWFGRDSADTRFQIGLAAHDAGDTVTARAQYLRSLDVARTADTCTALGDLEAGLGHYDRARAAYADALTLAPDDPIALFSMARLCAHQGERTEALAFLGRAESAASSRDDVAADLRAAISELRRALR